MTTFKEIDKALEEYRTPTKVGERILNSIDEKLYLKNPKACCKKLELLCKEAFNKKDTRLQHSVLYKWLDLTDCQDSTALLHLKFTSLKNLLSSTETPDLRLKVISKWVALNPIQHITDLLSAISADLTNSSIHRLDSHSLLQLINTHIVPNREYLSKKSLGLSKYLNTIITNLDLTIIKDIDAVKLLTLSPYIAKRATSKISKHYFPDNYETLLSTAQALGVIENTDYWIQNLPSIKEQHSFKTSVELPTV